jgi:hypothetical protein
MPVESESRKLGKAIDKAFFIELAALCILRFGRHLEFK